MRREVKQRLLTELRTARAGILKIAGRIERGKAGPADQTELKRYADRVEEARQEIEKVPDDPKPGSAQRR